MRYHFDRKPDRASRYGKTYCVDHPLYDRCTLYARFGRGLAVIQQRFDPETKHTYWDRIDCDLTDAIYLHPNFLNYFNERAKPADSDGLFPTVTVRQIMWALRMRPLIKHRWETVFDRKEI